MTPRFGPLKLRRPLDWALAAAVAVVLLNVVGAALSGSLHTSALGAPLFALTLGIFGVAGAMTTRASRRYVVGTFTGMAGGAVAGVILAVVELLLAVIFRASLGSAASAVWAAGSTVLVMLAIYTLLGTCGGALGAVFARTR